jgi:hypothetical protein
VTIWEEIDEARANRDGYRMGALGFLEVVPGLENVAPMTEFTEMEDRARRALDEYLSTRPTRVDDELERRACGAVLSYLLCYSHDQYQEKCTEYQISQTLGAPRPRVKKLLSRMAWDGVIESLGIGISSPYRIVNLGKAMKEGYLQLSPEEALKVTKMVHGGWQTIQLVGRSLVASLPESVPFTETKITIDNTINSPDQQIEPIMIPFHPGQVDHHYPWYDADVVDLFLGATPPDTLTEQVLMELDAPEKVTPREVRRGLTRVGEKHLKLTRIRIKPLLSILEEHGFEDGRRMIEKAYLRDKLLEMEHDQKGRRIPRRTFLRQGRRTVVNDRAVVPGHGDVSLQTQELTPTHIALLASVYRAACNFAELVGGDAQLIGACREEAARLESYIQTDETHEAQQESG